MRDRRKALKLASWSAAGRRSSPTPPPLLALRPAALDRKPSLSDLMERLIEQALIDAGIAFVTDQGGGTESRLDFHLPAFDVSIEVKRFYTARTGEQMARAPNVIVAQGERAIHFVAAAIRSGDFLTFVDCG